MNNRLCVSAAGEQWADIPGFHGAYQVSNLGRVRSCCLVRQRGQRTHYPQICIINPSTRRAFCAYVHQLVMSAFVGPRPPGHCVNHKDGNKWNPHLENLEYVTYKRNAEHAVEIGLVPVAFSGERWQELMRRHYDEGETQESLAKRFGVNICTINKALHQHWRDPNLKIKPRKLRRKITFEIAQRIRAEYAKGGKSQGEVGVMFGIEGSFISRIVNGKAWLQPNIPADKDLG